MVLALMEGLHRLVILSDRILLLMMVKYEWIECLLMRSEWLRQNETPSPMGIYWFLVR